MLKLRLELEPVQAQVLVLNLGYSTVLAVAKALLRWEGCSGCGKALCLAGMPRLARASKALVASECGRADRMVDVRTLPVTRQIPLYCTALIDYQPPL